MAALERENTSRVCTFKTGKWRGRPDQDELWKTAETWMCLNACGKKWLNNLKIQGREGHHRCPEVPKDGGSFVRAEEKEVSIFVRAKKEEDGDPRRSCFCEIRRMFLGAEICRMSFVKKKTQNSGFVLR